MFIKYLPQLHLALVVLICLGTIVSIAQVIAPGEVETLKQIGQTLRKTDWDFSVDPCSGQKNWRNPNATNVFQSNVTCNCSYVDNTVCHVVSIVLKGQNLQGTLPKELANLPFLREIDLTRNYLNGTIPIEWGSSKLVNISLLANRLSGPLPKELGNISTLGTMTLEFNQLSGTIPPELGNLPSLEKLFLTSNNFTGELPGTLAKLSTMKDFRIGDNNFVGSIPDFIQNWTDLQKLVIQGSGLSGPIPPGISLLKKLNDLRISDLNGNDSVFPDLGGAKKLKTLILRSCNIVGGLPDYLGPMTNLKVLDLSFNKLTGPVPQSFSALSTPDFIYLTGNFLTGQVPGWTLNALTQIDFSYNKFTAGNSNNSMCKGHNSNLFSSSSRGNTSGIVSCLRNFQCPKNLYTTLNINCGGEAVKSDDGKKSYEDDSDAGGPVNYFQSSKTNWAFSSTGNFLDDDHTKDSYIQTNNSRILSTNNSELYTTARLSPLSLTYYGFCLVNGNYTVNLHFAETMFTNDNTYSSLGRRIFDIFIQGKLVWKDFNIEDEAGGVYKPTIKPFIAQVTDNTLEIRFYWAGKGTIAIPIRGVYGPLISAISVDPNFPVPPAHKKSLSVGAIVGIVIGVLFAVVLLLVILWWKGFIFNEKDTIQHDFRGINLQTSSFTLKEIKSATNNFDIANKIGEGGFGPVYKGIMPDGRVIAVKQLSSKSQQGNREFINEIGMISALQHPNLVKLYGCCMEGNQLLLIYEYMENNSLARALFGTEEQQLNLDWKTRRKISVGIARGLAYLHEESRLKIVHRDIKATNVLLDNNMNPKISDFGLAKLDEQEHTHMSTRIAGTIGYMAPEYAMKGHLTDKADVYSFGIVLLEIVSGKSNTKIRPKKEAFYLLDWANLLKEKGDLMELVDERLGSEFNRKEVLSTINIALLCTDVLPNGRPNISTVLSMLENGTVNKKFLIESSGSNDKTDPKEPVEMENLSPTIDETMSLVKSVSMDDVTWTTMSDSASDLYPVGLNPGR